MQSGSNRYASDPACEDPVPNAGADDVHAGAPELPPVVESPPTAPHNSPAPHTSPWWTAPGGKAVAIPDFGQMLFDAFVAALAPLSMPAPRPIPLRVRARR